MEGINGTSKTLGRYFIRRSSHQQNSFSKKELKHKNPLENSFKSQKNRKNGKILWGILRQAQENTLGFKGIQTSQVLEAYRELSKSVTFELIWTLWHILVERNVQCSKTQYNEISLYFLRIPYVFTWFFFISLLFLGYLLYNTHIFVCMDMYVL